MALERKFEPAPNEAVLEGLQAFLGISHIPRRMGASTSATARAAKWSFVWSLVSVPDKTSLPALQDEQ